MSSIANPNFPATSCVESIAVVADYLTANGLPAHAPESLRAAARESWMEDLRTVSPTLHPRFPDFVVVHEAQPRNGLVYAVHAPTGLVFPTHAAPTVEDFDWLGDIESALHPTEVATG